MSGIRWRATSTRSTVSGSRNSAPSGAHEHGWDCRPRSLQPAALAAESKDDRDRARFPAGGRRERAPPRELPQMESARRSCRSNAFARSRRRGNWKALRIASDLRRRFHARGHRPAPEPGVTKRELVEALRREEVNRGLNFEYCLITAGTSLNRAPSDQVLLRGRHPLPRLGRQLPGLYRRPLPDGRFRRAGRGA